MGRVCWKQGSESLDQAHAAGFCPPLAPAPQPQPFTKAAPLQVQAARDSASSCECGVPAGEAPITAGS